MATAYVLMETNFEYNDDIYYTGEGGGGTPTKIYRSKESAEREQLIKCRNAFVNDYKYENGLRSIAEEIDEVLVDGWWKIYQGSDDLAKTVELLDEEKEPDLFLDDGSSVKFFKGMSQDQFKIFLFKCWRSDLPFTVEEVELEG